MITKRSLIALTSFFFLCAFLDQTALGQTKLDSCEKIKDSTDVSLLGTTSVELISAIQEAEADLKDSQSELTFATSENQLKTELDNLNKKTSKTAPMKRASGS